MIKTRCKTFLMHTGIDEGVFTLGFFDPGSRAGVILFTDGPRVILPVLKMLNADPDFISYLEAQV